MAYDPTAGDLHPSLNGFKPPAGLEDWTVDTASAIQDHVTTQNIADVAAQARNQFVSTIASTKDDLVSMAREDPTSAPLAFNLIDNFPSHMDGMKDHFRNQVAVAAVQGFAAVNRDAAHAAIDKYADYLGDGEADALRQHADGIDMLRQSDRQAAAIHQANMMGRLSDAAAGGYLNLLQDKTTGAAVFPANWGTSMMQDTRLSPQNQAALFTAYRNLQANGDPEHSDPALLSGLIKRAATGYQNGDHPTQAEIMEQTGSRLSLADAQFLSERIGPQNAATRQDTQRLSDAMDDARDMIDNRQAYGRFVDWLMPALRGGGSLDPNSKDYLLTPERMERFMPTGDDVIAPITAAVAARQRPSLGQIFAGGWTPPTGPAQPEKQWPTGPQGREEDNPKGPPLRIPGGGQRPF